jgi:hypothetical protein
VSFWDDIGRESFLILPNLFLRFDAKSIFLICGGESVTLANDLDSKSHS